MFRPYQEWAENEIRNAIWNLSMGMSIKGGRCDIEPLRNELKLRGLTTEGHHNT